MKSWQNVTDWKDVIKIEKINIVFIKNPFCWYQQNGQLMIMKLKKNKWYNAY